MKYVIAALGLGLLSVSSLADEAWVYIGDLQMVKSLARGKLSLNIDSLRRRATHYEIWERLVYEPDPARPASEWAEEMPDRHTLWAVRCRSGSLAKITERIAGAVEPRTELPRFYVPLPSSSGAAVIETTCTEVRRRANANKPVKAEEPVTAAPGLDRPPSIFDGDSFADDDD